MLPLYCPAFTVHILSETLGVVWVGMLNTAQIYQKQLLFNTSASKQVIRVGSGLD
jgi:hypothetical protein